jgi:short-subunit dehydrogenase
MTVSPRPLALVTGASGGIGADLARELAADGHDLVLVARSEAPMRALGDRLAQDHGIRADVVAIDLGRPGAAADLVADLSARGLTVDVLVNNAGIGMSGPFVAGDPAQLSTMVQLNVLTLTELTRALLPGMVARKRGRILNVASTAAFQPGPGMAAYYATKAYVLSLSEALAHELKGSGVTVTALCPGPTRTAFVDAADMGGSRLFRWGLVPVMDAADVARRGYQALKAGKPVAIAGLVNAMMAQSVRVTPRPIVLALAQLLNAKPH